MSDTMSRHVRGTSMDPCQVIHDALEAQGWDPKGPSYKFRANCPAHSGNSHQLRVNEGNDGQALVYCHTRNCEPRAIWEALGLKYSDMFPPGHENARDVTLAAPPQPKRKTEKLADLLGLLDEIGEPWQVIVCTDCMFCGSPGATIVSTRSIPAMQYQNLDGKWVEIEGVRGGQLVASCPNDCSDRAYKQGLMGRVKLSRAERTAA